MFLLPVTMNFGAKDPSKLVHNSLIKESEKNIFWKAEKSLLPLKVCAIILNYFITISTGSKKLRFEYYFCIDVFRCICCHIFLFLAFFFLFGFSFTNIHDLEGSRGRGEGSIYFIPPASQRLRQPSDYCAELTSAHS